jgi:hypothetical protein
MKTGEVSIFDFFQIRVNASLDVDPMESIPKEERGKVKETEVNYV